MPHVSWTILLFALIGRATATFPGTAALVYPAGTLFQFTLGVSVPVSVNKRGSVVSSFAFQFNYALPSNATDLRPTIISARQIRSLDLEDAYDAIENFLDVHGWQDGRECLLRSICEMAETPLVRTCDDDVLEEMIHLILTPTEDLAETGNSSQGSVAELYRTAERLGKSGGDCILAYPNCVESPLESFTELVLPLGSTLA